VKAAARFPRACVASPHHLASSAGLAVLASGGNALDAAVAVNLTLGVVTPYLCGFGGDLFAIVWNDGVWAYNGSGRAPAAATPEAVRAVTQADAVPPTGPHAVTVPGVVEAWFALLERFGTKSFEELAAWALQYATEGFVLSEAAAGSLARARERFADSNEWWGLYGELREGGVLRQPGLARTIETLAAEGPEAYYRGPIGRAIVERLRSLGGLMDDTDLAEHHGDWIEPLLAPYRDVEVLELPPSTQGVTALEALRIVDASGPLPPEGPDRQHLLLEAMKLALADQNTHVADPSSMTVTPDELLSDAWVAERIARIDPSVAKVPGPGRPDQRGTAYMCAADEGGMLVSLIQSNWMGFGSGVTVPDWGINLHNRGNLFSLDPAHPNAIGPRKRPLHTIIPAMAFRSGRPWLVFGSMGGYGQAGTHLQLLARIVDDGADIARAIDAPRWFVVPTDWKVLVEDRFEPALLEELRRRGHAISVTDAYDHAMGHAHAILVEEFGYRAAADPRSEGAALGL
jgi:gamma-glutamyltranspeptidase / glutathione hydrolase